MDRFNNKALGKLTKMPPKNWIAFLTLIVFGCSLIYIAEVINDPDEQGHDWLSFILAELGVLFVSIVPMVFIYERILRNVFLSEMEEKIRASIQDYIPENVNNIRESGVSDVYDKLPHDKIMRRLEKVENTKIRILKIWIPSMDTLGDCLLDAIKNRNCTVEIILCNPDCTEALEKRGRTYEFNLDRITSHINDNIADLRDIVKKLPDGLKDKLKLNLHRDFISLSMIGMENYFIIGFYLHNRLATNGTQVKVHGRDNAFYKELYVHFKHQFKMSEPYNLIENTAIPKSSQIDTEFLPKSGSKM